MHFAQVALSVGQFEGLPSPLWTWPFVALLLAIALLPLIARTRHWWEHNENKLLVALALAATTLGYYGLRGYGVKLHEQPAPATGPSELELRAAPAPEANLSVTSAPEDEEETTGPRRSPPGPPTMLTVLRYSLLDEYFPFLTLLFSLYVIAGGIVVRGDVPAHPVTNTAILGIGAVLASIIGTTGASMVLIRLLLKTNAERRHVAHTVVFFIFLVSNIGGTLLPIGDPPLFLGYLRGVPFLWTLSLWKEWAFMTAILLVVYALWDTWAYAREPVTAVTRDETEIEPVRVAGLVNIVWLIGVVLAVATLDPGKVFPGTNWHAPPYLREFVQLALAGLSMATTARVLRVENQFNFAAIGEVAALFIGIFITMQVPIELLHGLGPTLAERGFSQPWHFFWAAGGLSSFLDNAPTYVVYFETANALTHAPGPGIIQLITGDYIRTDLLAAISCGAVFMGANTYIGNGPNFMVKALAEQAGVKMPSFFGYMAYSIGILIPLFILVTLVFFRPV